MKPSVRFTFAAFEKAHHGTKAGADTGTAGYLRDGGLLDVTKEFGDWSEAVLPQRRLQGPRPASPQDHG